MPGARRTIYPRRVLLALLVVIVVLFVVLPAIGAALWSLLTTLLVGLVLGAIARVIAPGRGRMGLLFTAVVGVAGSLLGNLVAELLDTGDLGHLLLQVLSATVLVMVVRPHPTKKVRA